MTGTKCSYSAFPPLAAALASLNEVAFHTFGVQQRPQHDDTSRRQSEQTGALWSVSWAQLGGHVYCADPCVTGLAVSVTYVRPSRTSGRGARMLTGVHDVLLRIRSEHVEMPGLRLFVAQAQRIFGLDRATCESVLDALVEAKFLRRARDGAFVRVDGDTPVG